MKRFSSVVLTLRQKGESAGPVAGSGQQRNDQVADRGWNAVAITVSGNNFVPELPFEWPPGNAVREDRGSHVGGITLHQPESALRLLGLDPWLMPGVGHFPMLENPAGFAAPLGRCLERA